MARAITKQEFEQRIKNRFPNEKFKIIEYTATSNPGKIQCLTCGRIIEMPQAKNFLASHKIAGCSDCYGLRAKNKQNVKIIEKKYEILKVEKDDKGKIWYTCKCKNCGRVSTHLLISFLENTCRCEGHGNRWTMEEFKEALKLKYGDEYILLSNFNRMNDRSLFKHKCGFAWTTTHPYFYMEMLLAPNAIRRQVRELE